jgi:hypothetical protein
MTNAHKGVGALLTALATANAHKPARRAHASPLMCDLMT